MLPNTDEFWEQYEYIHNYGEKKIASDFMEYEKIAGKDWADALEAFDPVSHSMEKFHKEVVLPLLKKG
jgi:UDP-N-acetylmuramoylalanine-D-glutamate ligase